MRVVFDTNIYRGDKFRRGQAFKTLTTLLDGGRVELHLPYVVRREFETHLDLESAEKLQALKKASADLLDRPLPEDVREHLVALDVLVEGCKDSLIRFACDDFRLWLGQAGVKDLPLTGEHVLEAMKSYFVAEPPFKEAKRRDDIPDAMVYQSLVEFTKDGPVAFVCNDGRLAEASDKLANITRFKGLSEFIASKAVQSLIIENEIAKTQGVEGAGVVEGDIREAPDQNGVEVEGALEDVGQSVKDILAGLQTLTLSTPNAITNFVSEHAGDQLAGETFYSPSLLSDDRMAYIYMFGALQQVEFDWDSAAYHGDATYLVHFKGKGLFNINYYVSKWDAHLVEERGASWKYHNDYVVEADEEASLLVSGTLRIVIASEIDEDEDLVDAIEDMEIDSVDEPALSEDAT